MSSPEVKIAFERDPAMAGDPVLEVLLDLLELGEARLKERDKPK